MPKSILRIISFFLALTICLLTGIGVGIKMQANTFQNRGNEEAIQSSRIGIVNQDMGVLYSDKQVNFAEEIIDILPENYTLLSKAEAEYNMEAGQVAAIITFPSDFSNKVAGINLLQPEKATFTYIMNDKLSQKDTITTLLSIMDVEAQVSESISYMYVASIFNELHQAQSNVDNIITESEGMVQNAKDFQEIDFHVALEFSEIDFDHPETQMVNFAEFLAKNKEYLRTIESTTNSATEKVATGYQELLTNGHSNLGRLNNISDAINNVELLPKYLGEVVINSATGETEKVQYRDYFEFVEVQTDEKTTALLEALELTIQTAQDNILVSLGASNMSSLNLKVVQLGASEKVTLGLSVNEELEELYRQIYEEVTEDYKENIILGLSTDEAMLATLGFSSGNLPVNTVALGASWEEYLDNSMPDFSNQNIEHFINISKDNIMLIINAQIAYLLDKQVAQDQVAIEIFMGRYIDRQVRSVNNNMGRIRVPTSAVQSNTINAFSSVRDYIKNTQRSVVTNLDTTYKNVEESITDFEATMTAFEVFKYYDENQGEIESLYEKLDTNLEEWNTDIEKIISEREELLNTGYNAYMENINLLMEEAGISRETAEALLLSELETMMTAQTEKNETIKELTTIFANKLPNSHVGTQGNTDLYNFVVTPVDSSDITPTTVASGTFVVPDTVQISPSYQPITIVAIVLFLLLLLLVGYDVVKISRNRHKTE